MKKLIIIIVLIVATLAWAAGTYTTDNLTANETVTGEQVTSTDDIDATDDITAGGTVQAEHLYSTDDMVLDDDGMVKGRVLIGRSDEPYIPPLECVGFYRFDDNLATSTVLDYSQIKNGDFKEYGAYANTEDHHTTGKLGSGAFTFDGVDDSVVVFPPAGGEHDFTDGLSIGVWFKTATNMNDGYLIIKGSDAPSASFYLRLVADSGQFAFYLDIGGTAKTATTADEGDGYWADNEWHLAIATFNKVLASDRMKVYVDGSVIGTNDGLGQDLKAYAALKIWFGSLEGTAEFTGTLDNAFLYNTPLSTAEMDAIWNSGVGDESAGLTLYTDLNIIGGDEIVIVSHVSDDSNDLFINGDLEVHDDLFVQGDLSVDGSLADLVDITASGTIQGEHLYSTDDANIADILYVDGTMTVSTGSIIDSSGAISFGNENLSTTGTLGIGTNAPDSILHIKANVPGTVGSHPAGQLIIQDPDDTVFGNAVITGYESDGAGNPDQQLWYLGSSSSSNSNIIFLNRRNSKLQLGTNDVSHLTILGNGKVGIGVSDPDATLEILDTTNQLKLSYDATNYFTLTTQSDGDMTFDSNKASYNLDFGDGNLLTTGTLGVGAITGTSLTDGTATLDDGSLTSAINGTFSGTVQAEHFYSTDDANIADTLVVDGTLHFSTGLITDDGGTIHLADEDVNTLGKMTFAGGTLTGNLDVNSYRIIFDVDGDSYFESQADSDDTLHIILGGNDEWFLTTTYMHTAGNYFSDGTYSITVAEADSAYVHSQDNTQAHSDYLINDGNDSTSGILTAAGLIAAGDITVGSNDVTISYLNLEGSQSSTLPTRRGGAIKWYQDEDTLAGYTYVNVSKELVFDSDAQASINDIGLAYIDLDSGTGYFQRIGIAAEVVGANLFQVGHSNTARSTYPIGIASNAIYDGTGETLASGQFYSYYQGDSNDPAVYGIDGYAGLKDVDPTGTSSVYGLRYEAGVSSGVITGGTHNIHGISVAIGNAGAQPTGGTFNLYGIKIDDTPTNYSGGGATVDYIALDTGDGDVLMDGDITAGPINFAADAEASDTYVITLAPVPTAYTTGMMITFTATTANTGACTVNVNALGAKPLKALHDQDPPDNYIEAGSVVTAVYDSTNFQMYQPDANP